MDLAKKEEVIKVGMFLQLGYSFSLPVCICSSNVYTMCILLAIIVFNMYISVFRNNSQ